MDEDIIDELISFGLMLQGFVMSTKDLAPTDKERYVILDNWNSLCGALKERIENGMQVD